MYYKSSIHLVNERIRTVYVQVDFSKHLKAYLDITLLLKQLFFARIKESGHY